jgi:N-acetylmuramoyl-L-alanine amidase
MLDRIIIPSPNFELRPIGSSIDTIILHYTDMLTLDEALNRLCDSESKVSSHFLISKEGQLYQLVDPKERAWHAGVSSWQGEPDINSRSIGIELDNIGHSYGPEPFPQEQMTTLLNLLSELTHQYRIPSDRILGHSDVAPLRKSDPGEMFPWEMLAIKGFGLWPDKSKSTSFRQPNVLEIQNAFLEIGYACSRSGVWDEETQAVCRAFQRHFTRHEVTGYATELTGQTLQALLKESS